MKKFAFLVTAAVLAATPAFAAPVNNGDGIGGNPRAAIDPFNVATRGTLLAQSSTSGTALTFAGTFNSAVYKNTDGTLDFYYQVVRTGAGTEASNEIQSFTVQAFGGFTIDAFRDGLFNAAGFLTANNPGTFTSGATRSFSGNVAGVDFGSNNLAGTENSTTYIFRTNATAFTRGTFGVIDGSTLQGATFAPTVPEPATWAMMLGGFGLLGAAARRSSRAKTVLA
ncbi:PEP-CTERM sorting domain-containing protein [Sphingomonas sp. ID1715]|uniref:PEPxxWA-CTERM sorting domain-containing protein n=1 Tax=Sphingomonas sp. ID1715 TaxID=1656898 RepID=UPI001489CCD1|nr:PEPxxWA-CTERM sorting domain-containing protein [Sphingomonas sp. ID1715]NNM77911.1 PEP-CTERM sorting domain-containing protein [Sphingomonas sp. ID1715]